MSKEEKRIKNLHYDLHVETPKLEDTRHIALVQSHTHNFHD